MAKSRSLADLYNYVQNLITSMEVIPTVCVLPSFAELKSSPDKFYSLFSEATHNYNVICDTLQKLQHANAMMVKVMNDLMSVDCKETYVTKTLFIKNFTNARSECTSLIAGYETAKASSEAIVKFFNSAQFVITSNRFDGTHAAY